MHIVYFVKCIYLFGCARSSGFPGGTSGKRTHLQIQDIRDAGSIPGLSCGMRDLVLWPRTEPGSLHWECGVSHWKSRGVLTLCIDNSETNDSHLVLMCYLSLPPRALVLRLEYAYMTGKRKILTTNEIAFWTPLFWGAPRKCQWLLVQERKCTATTLIEEGKRTPCCILFL